MEQAPIEGLATIAVVIALFGAVLTSGAKLVAPGVHPPLANLACCLVVGMLFAWVLPTLFEGLPKDLRSWLTLSGSAAGLGGAAHFSFVKKPREKKLARVTLP